MAQALSPLRCQGTATTLGNMPIRPKRQGASKRTAAETVRGAAALQRLACLSTRCVLLSCGKLNHRGRMMGAPVSAAACVAVYRYGSSLYRMPRARLPAAATSGLQGVVGCMGRVWASGLEAAHCSLASDASNVPPT